MKRSLVKYVYDEFLDATGSEERSGQREAVRLLLELSGNKDVKHYGISAPTGTGKSYAALLAGVHNARYGRRTVIGTSTVVLSEQYARDMAVVRDVFPDVRFALLKGAVHYFCGNKVAEEMKKAKPSRKAEMLGQLKAFDKGHVSSLPVWATADTEYCAECAENLRKTGKSNCDYAKARRNALQSQVVVTTHAMIRVDLSLRGKDEKSDGVLGPAHLTIFDEAHNAAASLVYKDQFGIKSVNYLNFRDVLDALTPTKRAEFIEHFALLKEDGWNEEHKWVVPTKELALSRLAIWPTYAEIKRMQSRASSTVPERDQHKVESMLNFLDAAREVLDEIADGETCGNKALWTRGGSYMMQEMLPNEDLVQGLLRRRTAWMSATLGTKSKPKYSLEKCGLGSAVELFSLDSPFDYEKQLKWTVRTDSEVSSDAAMVAGLNGWVDGGTLVLTPYHKRKEAMTERLRSALPGTLVQMQANTGAGSAHADKSAVESHRELCALGRSPVLVGVEVFSTGIDLPGNELVKLVVADLFPLRDDSAYQAWRSRWLESVGGSGFRDYELPERAVMLEQQVGRVIRRVSDSGVVVFYLADRDWKVGSGGKQIVEEALERFPGVVRF